ncbi:MAG: hypothetical protein NTZ59_11720 [Bacteroidetes bacterium]|nr:hypothetical protein [Bacteroidota bacterium]
MLSYIADKIYIFFHLRKYKKAIKQANALRAKNFKKHFVIAVKGDFKVVSKQHLKAMFLAGTFKKGVKFREIEKMVVYTTK